MLKEFYALRSFFGECSIVTYQTDPQEAFQYNYPECSIRYAISYQLWNTRFIGHLLTIVQTGCLPKVLD